MATALSTNKSELNRLKAALQAKQAELSRGLRNREGIVFRSDALTVPLNAACKTGIIPGDTPGRSSLNALLIRRLHNGR